MNYVFKYFHQLIDSWLQRRKLNYVDYQDSIELENWWDISVQLEELCKLFINSDSNEQVFNFYFDS